MYKPSYFCKAGILDGMFGDWKKTGKVLLITGSQFAIWFLMSYNIKINAFDKFITRFILFYFWNYSRLVQGLTLISAYEPICSLSLWFEHFQNQTPASCYIDHVKILEYVGSRVVCITGTVKEVHGDQFASLNSSSLIHNIAL